MMVSLGIATWLRLIVWTFVGLLVYVFYGYQHSAVRASREATTGASGARL